MDHGNRNMKTCHFIFTTGLTEQDKKPARGEKYLKYQGKYYTLSEKRIPYQRDKTQDSRNRFWILTLFVLQCWIGQRFKDTQAINEGIIKETPNGRVIEIVQEKKTHKVSIPLLPIANEILNKYKGRFPIFTNQTALNYLTKIGEKAGIKRLHNVTEDRGGNVITKQSREK